MKCVQRYRYSAAIFILFYKFGGPLSQGGPKHCFFCFYVNPALTIIGYLLVGYYPNQILADKTTEYNNIIITY